MRHRGVTLTVYGHPAPQGSKRAFLNKHTGRPVMVEQTAARLHPWREDVRQAALAENIDAPLAGPLVVCMAFTFARPRTHYRTGRNAHLLRDNAPAYPHRPPDLSKLIRSTEDALTSAGLWEDDARVVRYVDTGKYWVGHPQALDRPGARIVVTELPPVAVDAYAPVAAEVTG